MRRVELSRGRIRNFEEKWERSRWFCTRSGRNGGGGIIATDRLTSIIVTFPAAATRFFYYFAPHGSLPPSVYSPVTVERVSLASNC